MNRSIIKPQHKLDAARSARSGGAGVYDAGDLSKAGGGFPPTERAQAASRIFEYGMVEQIESRGPEIQAELLRQLEGLSDRTVDFVVPGAAGDEAAQIAPGPFRRNRERSRVEPVVNGLIRRVERHTRNKVRALVGGAPVRQVRRLSRQRDIDWQPGAGEGDAGQAPSAQNLRCDTVAAQKHLAGSEGQLVDAVYRHGVADVNVGVAAVAGAAALILEGHGFTGANRSVGDSM